ncbi:DUF1761 domain-containing protein [Acidaminobacter sp. JC074]|uniref:DUF1761 domain-containing protein n=1 Tax=Acidaminobacter sp. JC074 TaxID=2530199 RepID=UPI001F0E9F7C|nr:DUF1761 domain-containing protein [Acidaminobacter sp. JC074]MCH4888698.1 DUF1761 domain-containing protein [Acidaminobacter sp. JC074]
MTFSVNIIGLIIGMILNMVLGMLWYSPLLFAKPWMKESGVTQEDVDNPEGMGKVYGMTGLTALITSYVIGFLITNLNITSIFTGILFAIILWLGTDLSSLVKNWGFENRTIKLGIINHGYDLAVYILITIVFVLFK